MWVHQSWIVWKEERKLDTNIHSSVPPEREYHMASYLLSLLPWLPQHTALWLWTMNLINFIRYLVSETWEVSSVHSLFHSLKDNFIHFNNLCMKQLLHNTSEWTAQSSFCWRQLLNDSYVHGSTSAPDSRFLLYLNHVLDFSQEWRVTWVINWNKPSLWRCL